MDHYLLIIELLILPVLNNAETADYNTSITKTTWFWPLLSICLALLLSVPCTLITLIIFCSNKNESDDSDESSINSTSSSSSSSSTPVPRRHVCHHARHQRSHYAGACRTPPPPYTTCEQHENLFVTSSLPPPYESHLIENGSPSVDTNPTATIINVQPTESSEIQSSINHPRQETVLDVSSTLTNPSIQTFQV